MRILVLMLLATSVMLSSERGKQPVVFVPEATARTHIIKSTKAIVPGDLARCNNAVVLETRVGPDGHVESIRSLSGNPLFIPSAIQALKDWEFDPYRLNGKAVPFRTKMTLKCPRDWRISEE